MTEGIKMPNTQTNSLALNCEDISKVETTHQQSRHDLVKDDPKSTCSLSSRRDNSGSSSQMSVSANVKKNRSDKLKLENTEERVAKGGNKPHNDFTGTKVSGVRAMKSTDKFVHRKRYAIDSSSSSESSASLRPKPDAFDEMIFNSNFNPVASNHRADEFYQSHKSRASSKVLTSAGSKSSLPAFRPKQYRKLSPPKVKNHASRKSVEHSDYSESSGKDEAEVKSLARRSDVNTHLLRDEQRRESAGPTAQFSYVRSSSSAMIKGELLSPRLVRCATTRQLSPLYGHKPSTPMVSRLQPLPTPPPEGRMKLKPVSKNSSISQNSCGSTHGTEFSDGP
ncbi:unnamed protein product [Lymnaea stagnalis]|uniref:Uncharacterized protein n=1 Tax=Lymnaea stagnalis TaxID=6523 RepID=A0AAV2H431_LYMST